jgi:TonB-linked SusC/RagA family outer membrane protein
MMHFKRTHLQWCLCAALSLLTVCSKAQTTAQVKGVVTTEDGHELQGVNVSVTEATGGKEVQKLATNDKGLFTVARLKGGGKYDFTFTYVGYELKTVKAFLVNAGDNNSLLVRMKEAGLNTTEAVVVTALGIKREEKSLGYAAQAVNENAVKDAKSNNWVNTLSGKVAGLNIQGTGSGPMGSSRITLRGESSLNLDNNQALIVVDGVPVSSKITGTGYKSHLAADSPVDFGSGVSDINPDDIEKITVLKGAGATALYGSRAAGGAIIITTKSGRTTKGLGVTYNLNVSMDQVNRYPDYQYEYGEGRTDAYFSYGNSADGVNTATTAAAGRAWGPKFKGQSYFQYNPNVADGKPTERTPWVAQDDYIKGFFQTGRTVTNSVAIEGATDKSTGRLSFTHLKNDWILPNTGFERINVALSFNHKLTDKFKITGKVNYTNKKSDNLPASGYNNQTIMYFLIIGTTPNIRPEWFKPYWQPGLEQVQQRNPFNSGPDNPYLDLYEMLNKMNKHGVVGNTSATYTFSDKLEAQVRTGIDMGYEFRTQQRPFSMTKFPRGMYREQTVFNYEVNTDALITYKDKINADLKYSVSAGANAMRQKYTLTDIYADQLSQPGVYQISNSLNPAVSDPQRIEKAINSIYGFGQVSYKEKIFVDVTGRNDWSSSLPFANCSFFYPSVSSSFLLHELVKLPATISFAKLRFSWAQVGNDTRPYQTEKYYDKIYGNNFTSPTTLYNPNLKPEITTSYEAGIDFRMLKGRIGADIAVYTNKSRNQILAVPVDPTSGFAYKLLNAGLINSKGVEVQLTGKPVNNKNFKWNTTLTWSMNRSYVRELAAGVPSQIIYSHDGNVTIEARPGGRMGDMYGLGFQRSPEGKIIYTTEGVSAALDPVAKKWGNAFADWKAGLMNEFTIKNFRISVLLDGQKGGSMYSQTNHKNNTLGKTKVTLPGRDGGIVGDGVVLQSDGKYVPNTKNVKAVTYYENIYAITNAEMNIFDASYLKLREARIEFNLPRHLLSGIGISQTSVAIYGRDLFNITSFPGFDPEGGNLNSGTLTPGVELAQFPSTRNMGVNLTFKF